MGSLRSVVVLLLSILCIASCQFRKAPLGSKSNPVKLFFVPSVEAQLLEDKSKDIEKLLEEFSGYEFEVRIPHSYIAVVEALGSDRADIATLNTFGYVLAHEKYGAQAALTVLRQGKSSYRSQILVRSDNSSIRRLEDLSGKKIAFVDPASTSGYLLPLKLLSDRKVKIGRSIFAMKHDSVVSMIYRNEVDAGATFYSPPHSGQIQDARRLLLKQIPDVEEKIRILELTDAIPNEPVVFRKDIPDDMKTKLVQAFIRLGQDGRGKKVLNKLMSITELKKSSDKDYEPVRKMLRDLGQSAENLMSKQ